MFHITEILALIMYSISLMNVLAPYIQLTMDISMTHTKMTEMEAAYQSNSCNQYIPPYVMKLDVLVQIKEIEVGKCSLFLKSQPNFLFILLYTFVVLNNKQVQHILRRQQLQHASIEIDVNNEHIKGNSYL